MPRTDFKSRCEDLMSCLSNLSKTKINLITDALKAFPLRAVDLVYTILHILEHES